MNHHALATKLDLKGWCVAGSAASTFEALADEVLALAQTLGEIAPGRSRQPVERVIPQTTDSAFAGSLSSKYGLSSLPLHTDTAHWTLPCRYLVMACTAPGPVPTPTLFLDGRHAQLTKLEEAACYSAVFLVRNGRRSFYGSVREPGRPFIRIDPGCMTPLSSDGEITLKAFSFDRQRELTYRHEWQAGEILAIDNWRVLHGRGGGVRFTCPWAYPAQDHGEMIRGQVSAAITKEGLLAKSRVYIHRAFRAKLANDFDEYQLWASLALELLGKAALAAIHPSLMVDPTHYESLFAAAGVNISTDIKTITAGTLYKRLGHLSKYFDTKVKEFCDNISLRRNAELHSGEVPFQEMRLEAWEGRYWQAGEIIAGMLNSSLDEWIGVDRAKTPKELVRAAAEATLEAAKKRVEQAKEHFLARPKKERESALRASETKHTYHYPKLFRLLSDHEWEVECPSCTGRAFLAGIEFGEEVLDTQPGEDGWEEEVEKQYGAEEFQCPTCDLHLDSRQEIEAAGIDPDHSETEMREREYEPDYGNC